MLFQQIIKDILNNNTYIKMTAALKEQMADLEETLRKNQNKLKDLKKKESDMLKENEKNLLNLKKEYDIWQKYKNYWMFQFIDDFKNNKIKLYKSFEELIRVRGHKYNTNTLSYWELLFNELKYTDKEFFNTFVNWDDEIQKIPMENRKCSICLDYYKNLRCIKQYANCVHKCCTTCYPKIKLQPNGFKCCPECRTSEKPIPKPVIVAPVPVIVTPTPVIVTPTPVIVTHTPVIVTPTPVIVTPTPVIVLELDDESDDEECTVFVFEGKTYLKSDDTDIVYDYDAYNDDGIRVVVGKWNNTTNSIEEYNEDE